MAFGIGFVVGLGIVFGIGSTAGADALLQVGPKGAAPLLEPPRALEVGPKGEARSLCFSVFAFT